MRSWVMAVAAVADRAAHGGELERLAHLVELGDAVHVRERRLEAALGMALDVALGVEPGERLADRRAGHLEHAGEPLLAEAVPERELADEQTTLQGPVRRLASRLGASPRHDGASVYSAAPVAVLPDVSMCLATYESAIAVASPSCERNENANSPPTPTP